MKVFFQNGPSRSHHVMCGQGHITGVRISDGLVSDIHVPRSKSAISLTDFVQRKWLAVLYSMMLSRPGTVHSGTCNTAVINYADKILAVEESSKPFQLNVVDGIIQGGEWLEDEVIHGVHPLSTDVYSFTPFRNSKPLVFNGKYIDWKPRKLPLMIHSYLKCDDWVIFPIMSTRYGNFFSCFVGKKLLPTQQSFFEWLIHNERTNASFCIKTNVSSDVFHLVHTKIIDNETLVIYASHVNQLERFLQTQCSDCLHFSFQKTTINITSKIVQCIETFEDASGDFPSMIEQDIILINRMTEQSVVFFNISSDTVIHTVHLQHSIRDVVYDDGHLFYCTNDNFYKCDIWGNIVFQTPIPSRFENFHSCIINI